MKLSQIFYLLTFILLAIYLVGAPPVDPKKKKEKDEEEEGNDLDDFGLEYGRYLQQVVQALEEDKDFAKKLENISTDQIKSGDVAKELEFVKHNVRTKLDELKRIELERLRKLSREEMERSELGLYRNEDGHLAPPSIDGRRWRTITAAGGGDSLLGINRKQVKMPHHVDLDNKHTFEVEDLRKLMKAATRDLEELDRRRREEFKQYELEKEFQYRESLKNMSESERAEEMKKHEELVKKHKDHPKVHHPGSKQQLEQVWEEQDHMQGNEFDPRVFFAMHDVNGDGYLDEQEIEAILSLEIKKMYDPQNNVEDDPQEMMEEYNRMREHVYKETDQNKDGLISKEEFMEMTKKADFEKDDGWKGLDEQQIYTEEEIKAYEKKRMEELQKMNAYYGYQNAHGGGPVPHGMSQYPGVPPQPGYQPHQVPQGMHHQQVPQGLHNQQVPQGMHHQQVPQGMHHQQVPQGMHHQQVPQGMHHQQVPQGMHHQQVPQGMQHQQIPQGMQHQQVPQGMQHQQVPQGMQHQQVPQGIHQQMPQQPHPNAQYGIPNNQNPQMRYPTAQGIHPGVQIVQGNAHGLPTHPPSIPPTQQPQPTQYNPQQRQPIVEQRQADRAESNKVEQQPTQKQEN